MNAPLLLAHCAATLFMVGLIWFVQVVHYPLFARVGVDGFTGYEIEHQRRTSRVVGPVMLVEAATAAAILLRSIGDGRFGLGVAGALLLTLIWLSTAFVQVPLHRALQERFDARAARHLVVTNWLRTVAWTARGGIALAML